MARALHSLGTMLRQATRHVVLALILVLAAGARGEAQELSQASSAGDEPPAGSRAEAQGAPQASAAGDEPSQAESAWANSVTAQLGLDAQWAGAMLHFGYAFAPRWLAGVALGMDWAGGNDGSSVAFDSILGEAHATAFARYLVADFAQAELGATMLSFFTTDDVVCDDPVDASHCGTLIGAHAAIALGYRHLFLGTRLRIGHVAYADGRTLFGAILTPLWLRVSASF